MTDGAGLPGEHPVVTRALYALEPVEGGTFRPGPGFEADLAAALLALGPTQSLVDAALALVDLEAFLRSGHSPDAADAILAALAQSSDLVAKAVTALGLVDGAPDAPSKDAARRLGGDAERKVEQRPPRAGEARGGVLARASLGKLVDDKKKR